MGLRDGSTGSAVTPTWVRRKLFLATLILNAFVIGIVALVLRQSLHQYSERARLTVENLSRVLEEDLSGSFDAIDLTLMASVDEAAREMANGGIDGRTFNNFLNRHYSRLPQIQALRVADENGRILYGTGEFHRIDTIGTDREYVQRLRDNPQPGLVISEPLFGRQNPVWKLIFARRLNHPDGSFAGFVFAPVGLQALAERLAAVDIGKGGRVVLRNNRNALVATYPEISPVEEVIGQTRISQSLQSLLEAGQPQGAYRARAGTDQVERTLSFRRLIRYPFYVVVGLANADTFAEWRTEAMRLYGLAALFALATTVSSFLIYRSSRERRIAIESLAEQEVKFRTIADFSNDIEHWVDANGRLVWINPAVKRLTGYSVEECLAMADYPLPTVRPEDRQKVRKAIATMVERCTGADEELRLLRKDGTPWIGAVSWQVVYDAKGSFAGHRASIRDITNRKTAEQRLRRSEELLAEVQDVANLGWYVYDAVADRWESSKILDRILGIDAEFLRTARTWLKLVALDSRREIGGYFLDVLAAGTVFDKEYRILRPKDGAERWISVQGRIERDGNGRALRMVGTILDVTERKRAEARIEFLADHDSLTGLPNRVLGKDRLELAIARADRLKSKAALMFLDLDHFKKVNDSLGHSIGDALLKAVADRLRECVRETDTICRQGGDEFLIVLDDIRNAEAASRVADEILSRLVKPFAIDGFDLFVSASIGIAIYPDDADDFETLLKRADTSMYYAKEAGRNTYRFFTERMNVDANEYLKLRNGLRRGLENREFVLHYQPQIDLSNGRIVGVEALIRWQHPDLGLVPPGQFIPVAEDSGLIVPIGEWVLEEACRQVVEWQRNGLPRLAVAVNLSAVQFRRGGLMDSVVKALDRAKLAPHHLELELTESILIKDTENVLQTIRQLKALGVKLSIDDFGTGYSSLAYLKRFDVDKLKIDQSFIRAMTEDESDAAIVHAIIRMGRSLGLKTIAEGVEQEAAVSILRGKGCDEVQGYLFGRPMPAEDVEVYVLAAGGRVASLVTAG